VKGSLEILKSLAKFCAVLGGVLLTFITLLTCVSLIGRNTIGLTLAGDFELTGVVAGAAIALFMPWCQARRGNIIVDFFTAKASARTNASLDRLGALILAVAIGLLAWRSSIGGLHAFSYGSGSQILGFPDWIVFAFIVPPLVLTAIIALTQAIMGFDSEDSV
jgi:TRAP-type C4-dicarboxylate transport system permease small subunit